MDLSRPLTETPTLLQTVTDLLTALTEHDKTSATRYVLYYTI